MYSSPTCPPCIQAKEWLKENSIEYKDINVQDPEKAREMIEKTGSRGTPTFVIDGEVLIGFDQEKLEKLIK